MSPRIIQSAGLSKVPAGIEEFTLLKRRSSPRIVGLKKEGNILSFPGMSEELVSRVVCHPQPPADQIKGPKAP